jgi:tRNA (guanine10-N2)-methyltransferase
MKEYLVFFVHRHLVCKLLRSCIIDLILWSFVQDFRFPELDAVLTMLSLNPTDCYDRDQNPLSSPIVHIRLPSEEQAKFLSQRGILVKGVYEIWGHGHTYDQVVQTVAGFEARHAYINDARLSWKINVDAFGLKLSMEQQAERRERFRHVLPFQGPVVLKNPSNTFLILEDIGVDEPSSVDPRRIFFLRTLAGSQKNRGRGGARDLVNNIETWISYGNTHMTW